MSNQYQSLVSTFIGKHNLLLTSLLSTEDPKVWEECKHIIVCSTPLLTLGMVINRVITKENNSNGIPTPEQIQKALDYAYEKRTLYLQQMAKDTLMHY